jgi:gluconolactonase
LGLAIIALLALGAGRPARVGAAATPAIVTLDPAFSRIVPDGAQIEKLAGGFTYVEGPVWDRAGGFLLFTEGQGANKILQWTPDGRVTTFRHPSHDSNGLTLDRQGRLIACEQENRRVTRTEKDGTIVSIVEQYEGRRLNSPNDVVVRSDGSIYFTDPDFGNPWQQELPYQGVFRVSPDGRLTLLADDFAEPNGLAFSPDEKTLYVDDSFRPQIRAFDVKADGTLANGRVFAPLTSRGNWAADGMKVDGEGDVYCTGPGAIEVFDPQGKPLGRIICPELADNLGWGDVDGKGLFVTAQKSLYHIRLNIPGVRPGP